MHENNLFLCVVFRLSFRCSCFNLLKLLTNMLLERARQGKISDQAKILNA